MVMLLKLLSALAAVLCVTTGRDGSSNLSSKAVGWTSNYCDSNRHLWKYPSLEMVEWIFRFLINSTKTVHIWNLCDETAYENCK